MWTNSLVSSGVNSSYEGYNSVCSPYASPMYNTQTCPEYYFDQVNGQNTFEGPYGNPFSEAYNNLNVGSYINDWSGQQSHTNIVEQSLHIRDQNFLDICLPIESYPTQSYPTQSQPFYAPTSMSQPNFQSVVPQQQSSLEGTLEAFMAKMENYTNTTLLHAQAIAKLGNQMEQLANHMREEEEENFSSESVVNPNW